MIRSFLSLVFLHYTYALHTFDDVCQTHLYRNNGQRCICWKRFSSVALCRVHTTAGEQQRWQTSKNLFANLKLVHASNVYNKPARKHQGNKPWDCELFANRQRGFDTNCSRAVLFIVDPAFEANAVRTSCYITHSCQLCVCNIESLMSKAQRPSFKKNPGFFMLFVAL